jgi:hypothetical protein
MKRAAEWNRCGMENKQVRGGREASGAIHDPIWRAGWASKAMYCLFSMYCCARTDCTSRGEGKKNAGQTFVITCHSPGSLPPQTLFFSPVPLFLAPAAATAVAVASKQPAARWSTTTSLTHQDALRPQLLFSPDAHDLQSLHPLLSFVSSRRLSAVSGRRGV